MFNFARSARGGRRGRTGGELRLTLLAGALLGLVYANYSSGPVTDSIPFDAGGAKAVDPWADSRASRVILEKQEWEVPAPAIRIIDGDTFWYGGEKIRIADIDTPETRGARCAYEARLGQRATRRLEALLSAGSFEIRSIEGRDEDRFGRKLRILTRNGRSIGDTLVAEGLARTWTGRREPWC